MKEYDKKYIQDILTSSFRGTKKEFDDFINTEERFNEISKVKTITENISGITIPVEFTKY